LFPAANLPEIVSISEIVRVEVIRTDGVGTVLSGYYGKVRGFSVPDAEDHDAGREPAESGFDPVRADSGLSGSGILVGPVGGVVAHTALGKLTTAGYPADSGESPHKRGSKRDVARITSRNRNLFRVNAVEGYVRVRHKEGLGRR